MKKMLELKQIFSIVKQLQRNVVFQVVGISAGSFPQVQVNAYFHKEDLCKHMASGTVTKLLATIKNSLFISVNLMARRKR